MSTPNRLTEAVFAIQHVGHGSAMNEDQHQGGESRRERKKVEMLFAHLKRIMKLDRLRLRGLNGAQDEFLMATTAQNLRRMAKWLMPIRSGYGNEHSVRCTCKRRHVLP